MAVPCLVVAGGFSSTYQRLRDVDCLPLVRRRETGADDVGWRPLPPLTKPRVGCSVAALRNGAVLVAGGAGDASVELYETYGAPAEQLAAAPVGAGGGAWRMLPPMLAERSGARACTLGDGRVLVLGGLAKGGRVILDSVECFDPASESWTSLAPMFTGRVNFAACVLPGGSRVVALGGEVNGLDMSQRIAQSVELYDSITNSWSCLPDMSVERYGCGCGVLADGAVVVVGGYGGKDQRPQAQVAAAESATKAGSAPLSAGAAAAVVGGFASMQASGPARPAVQSTVCAPAAPPDSSSAGRGAGRLRMNGCACCAMFTSDDTKGVRGRHLHSAELLLNFDDAQGKASDWTWVPGPAMRTARKGFADVCFDDGLLVIGGVDTDGNTLCGSEYLPAEDSQRQHLNRNGGMGDSAGDAAVEALPTVDGMKYSKGSRVTVVGLTGAAHYNGQDGTVIRYDESKARYAVQLDDALKAPAAAAGGGGGGRSPAAVKPLAVKETNLEPLWGWEEGCGGKEASSGAATAWVLPPMLAPRTSFGAAITTTLALGMPALPNGGANVGA